MLASAATPVRSLYVHVPFCAQKCEYCAFYSEAAHGQVISRYVAALLREMELVHGDLKPGTVFFGGGTPSLLNLQQWRNILETMGRLELLGAAEWTIECNPATVSLEKASLWRRFGVDRISMGVQSLDEPLLDRLGRVHSRQMVFKSYDLLRQAGFENINLDLMFGIPGQTLEVWRSTLAEAIQLDPEHLSCYEVIYEEDTALFAQLQAGEFTVDEDLNCAMFDELLEAAHGANFHQYEIANFARNPGSGTADVPQFACQHNINYWRGGSYYGLGPSAAGYVGSVRTKNWSNTPLYCEKLERGSRAIEWEEQLSPLRRAGETAAFGLRMNSGWRFDSFRQATGFDLRQEWAPQMGELLASGWAKVNDGRFHLTAAGLRFADAAAERFLK